MVPVENTANPWGSRVLMLLKRALIAAQSKVKKIVIQTFIGHRTHYANAQWKILVAHVLAI